MKNKKSGKNTLNITTCTRRKSGKIRKVTANNDTYCNLIGLSGGAKLKAQREKQFPEPQI